MLCSAEIYLENKNKIKKRRTIADIFFNVSSNLNLLLLESAQNINRILGIHQRQG